MVAIDLNLKSSYSIHIPHLLETQNRIFKVHFQFTGFASIADQVDHPSSSHLHLDERSLGWRHCHLSWHRQYYLQSGPLLCRLMLGQPCRGRTRQFRRADRVGRPCGDRRALLLYMLVGGQGD